MHQGCKRVLRSMRMPETTARETNTSSPFAPIAAATPWDYEALREIVRNEPVPLALVALDRFDENVRQFAQRAAVAGKTVRVASKSIRVPELLKRAFAV